MLQGSSKFDSFDGQGGLKGLAQSLPERLDILYTAAAGVLDAKRVENGAKHNANNCFSHRVSPPWSFVRCALLLNDSVGSCQHIRRDREADLFCGFQIDDELKLRWLLDGQLSRLCSLEDFIDVYGGTPETLSVFG